MQTDSAATDGEGMPTEREWLEGLPEDRVAALALDPRHWRWFQRPERADDPLRPIWFRIHHDHQYEPSNVEARFLGERLKKAERERDFFEGALRVIQQNAESWHGDDVAKGRALTVIAATAKEALPDA